MLKDITTLICSGGGIRGVSYVGVFKRMEELFPNKLNITTVCGVSAGTLFGLMYILGYNSQEMMKEILDKNFSRLKDVHVSYLLTLYGIETGNNIMTWIETLLIKKGISKDVTFRELYELSKIEFQVCVTNLSKYTYEIFNYKTQPDMKVTTGIRSSISIPFVFTIERHQDNIYVDGGLINAYPIEHFKDNISSVLGIKLDHEESSFVNISGFESYIYNVINCFLIHREKYEVMHGNKDMNKQTLRVQSGDVAHTLKFSLSKEEKMRMIQKGYESARSFFASYGHS